MKKQLTEVSFEDAEKQGAKDLKTLLDTKAKDKLSKIPALQLLKQSKFYMNGDNLREHIANYKDRAILLKQELLREEIEDNEKEIKMFYSLILVKDLKKLKKINKNTVRKMQPSSLLEHEKMMLVQKAVDFIDLI